MEFQREELVRATQNFSPERLIGKGSHGSIYLGKLADDQVVAIKKSLVGATTHPSELENEISVLSSIPESPYIIKFLGTSSNNKVMVMEYMPNGSLHDLLHLSSTPTPWPKRVEIAVSIAKAVHALHEETPVVIIHRDIKPSNVLFDSNWKTKLADFGLAVGSEASCKPAGTIGYMDPCYTSPSELTTKVDVYSFGVVLLEIISGRKAIDVTKAPASVADWAVCLIKKRRWWEILDKRVQLSSSLFMEGTIRRLLYVAARCVSPKHEDRPSMVEIISGLDTSSLVIERVWQPSSWIGIIRSVLTVRSGRNLVRAKQRKRCIEDKFYTACPR